MMLHTITRKDLLDLVYRRTEEFLASIRRFDAYNVRFYYGREKVLAFNKFLKTIRHAFELPWHPYLDGCPDYHCINDEYPSLISGRGCIRITSIGGIQTGSFFRTSRKF